MVNRFGQVIVLMLAINFLLFLGVSLAEETVEIKLSEPEAALIEAEKMLANQPIPEILPIAESENDGYWWNKQNKDTKQEYIKQLIELFEVADKNLKIRNIIKKINSRYDPKDDPTDIKIDMSIERMFNEVIK